MREALRSLRATIQKRPNVGPKARSRPLGAPLALGRHSRRVWERLRGGPGTLLEGSWPFLARPKRSKIAFGPAFGCPKAVSGASGRVPETALGAQKGSRPIFRRFWVDRGSIFGDFRTDFRSIFRSSRVQRRHKNRLSKRSRMILSACPGPCVVQSLRAARTSFEMTFEHCMFALFSLRTHKYT